MREQRIARRRHQHLVAVVAQQLEQERVRFARARRQHDALGRDRQRVLRHPLARRLARAASPNGSGAYSWASPRASPAIACASRGSCARVGFDSVRSSRTLPARAAAARASSRRFLRCSNALRRENMGATVDRAARRGKCARGVASMRSRRLARAGDPRYAARPMHEPRTEPASPRKLARARRDGIVARSADLIAAAALLALAGVAAWSAPRMWHVLRALLCRRCRRRLRRCRRRPRCCSRRWSSSHGSRWPRCSRSRARRRWPDSCRSGRCGRARRSPRTCARLDPSARLRALLSAERWIEPRGAAEVARARRRRGVHVAARHARAVEHPRRRRAYALSVLVAARVRFAAARRRCGRAARQRRSRVPLAAMAARAAHGPRRAARGTARAVRSSRATRSAPAAVARRARARRRAGDRRCGRAAGRRAAAARSRSRTIATMLRRRAPRVLVKAQGALAAQLRLDAERRAVPCASHPRS